MKHFALFFFLLLATSAISQEAITSKELKAHIHFLASNENKGRFPGTEANKKVVDYIKKDFRKNGIKAFHGNYEQSFDAKIKDTDNLVKTSNVVGYIEGNDPNLKDEFIVLGAHYDHLGIKNDEIYNGANDNASGTAALLEISERIATQRETLKRSVIFIAFGAEEQGLLGSKYFVENPWVPKEKIVLMINMDMLGRLNKQKHVYMGGAGTFPGGEKLMGTLGEEFGLTPIVHAYSVGGSDHVSFYRAKIPVLGIHTGGHDEYHTPEDDAGLIDYKGEVKVAKYIYKALMELATRETPIYFIPEDKK